MSSTLIPTRIYNTNTVFEVDDDFDILLEEKTDRALKKEIPDAVFKDDPVALSITSYLIWIKNPHRRWVTIDEVGQVVPEARAMAHELRQYFLHRGTMKVLQGQTPTEFQYKMNAFLSDIRPLKTDELGLLYRLPYFWQEDMALDRVFEGATDITVDHEPQLRHITMIAPLTPIREVLKSRRSGDMVQFWFANTEGQRCVYTVRSDNSLISVFRSLYKQEKLQIKAQASWHQLPGSHIRTRFWKLSALELA
jgi:hypothetical protein